MKRKEDNKRFIQIKDLLFLGESGIVPIPSTVWDKVFANDNLVGDVEAYVELDTMDEIKFVDSLDFIYDVDYLSNFSSEELYNEINNLKFQAQEHAKGLIGKSLTDDMRKTARRKDQILEYKEKSLTEYVEGRIKIKTKIHSVKATTN